MAGKLNTGATQIILKVDAELLKKGTGTIKREKDNDNDQYATLNDMTQMARVCVSTATNHSLVKKYLTQQTVTDCI